MSLRKQLLAFAALSLVLPWAGFQFVQQMEAVLRVAFEENLVALARTVAQTLGRQAGFASGGSAATAERRLGATTLYAHRLAAPPSIDGTRDDWSISRESAHDFEAAGRVTLGIYGAFVYLFVEVSDDELVYQRSPGEAPYGDRLVIMLEPESGSPYWLLLHATGPGNLRAQRTRPPAFTPMGFDDRVLAIWQEHPSGYDVELRLPLSLVGAGLGLGVIDVDRDDESFVVSMSTTWDTSRNVAGRFIYEQEELEFALEPFVAYGDRLRVIDHDGWILSDVGSVDVERTRIGSNAGSLAEDVFRFVLRRDDPPYQEAESPAGRIEDERLLQVMSGESLTVWYRGASEQAAIVSAVAPIHSADAVVGAVIVEQVSDAILTSANRALIELMSFSLLAMTAVVVGMLGFATILSVRVTRLARAADRALGPKGEIDSGLPGRRAKDEIGDLARSFAGVLERLREHTSYLRTLTSKLSHELRSPLAVVSTSLDNLEKELADDESQVYLTRLRSGADRLDAILASMSEATNMEQAIADAVPEPFDLAEVVDACCRAYDDVYGGRNFRYFNSAGRAPISGSRDLIAQLMDKLVDNAVGFSPEDSSIEVTVAEDGGGYALSVLNRGPLLPDTMRSELFDSLVSVRTEKGDQPHLGLGLYIASLIVDFHGGRVVAENLPDGSGVVFRLWFPQRKED
jgi:two-component system sensor histidine kinase ChvG